MTDRRALYQDTYDIGDGYNMSFKFRFVEQDSGEIYIYILSQPSYKPGQDTSSHNTHRYNTRSRPYICYEPQPRNLEVAKTIASEWARRTAYYIKHGNWPNVGSSITR